MYISVSAPYCFPLIFTTFFWGLVINTEIGFRLCSDLEFTFVSLPHNRVHFNQSPADELRGYSQPFVVRNNAAVSSVSLHVNLYTHVIVFVR